MVASVVFRAGVCPLTLMLVAADSTAKEKLSVAGWSISNSMVFDCTANPAASTVTT